MPNLNLFTQSDKKFRRYFATNFTRNQSFRPSLHQFT